MNSIEHYLHINYQIRINSSLSSYQKRIKFLGHSFDSAVRCDC